MWQCVAPVRDDGRTKIDLLGMRSGNQLVTGPFWCCDRACQIADQKKHRITAKTEKMGTNGPVTKTAADQAAAKHAGRAFAFDKSITGQE